MEKKNIVYFITHTEPSPGYLQKGNLSRFYVRQFNLETLEGKSLFFDVPVDMIIPSFEMPKEDAMHLLEKLAKDFKDCSDVRFERRYYNTVKDVIWAHLSAKERKEDLPKNFLKKKFSASKFLRWMFPPFLEVDVDNGNLIFKKEMSYVSPEILYKEKKCALDIETTGWMHPGEKEEITAAVLNFSNGVKKIVNVFKCAEIDSLENYSISYVENTDGIKRFVEESILEQDPLFVYFFNGSFDKKRLRDLGREEFRPGTDYSAPVFKSAQALKNMIMKGRWDIELYGYVFLYRHLFKNNKLETHARQKKTLDHVELELLTKKAIGGDKNAANQILKYVADDGNITLEFGNELLPLIIPKAHFVKREPSTICTSSGTNIMREYWDKKFWFLRGTYLTRYDFGKPEEIGFDAEEKKDEVLNLEELCCEKIQTRNGFSYKKPSGFFESLQLFYPMLFIRTAWPMIRGTTENLRFGSPDEQLNFAQTLNGYITHALERYYLIAKQKENGNFPENIRIRNREVSFNVINYEFRQLFSQDLNDYNKTIDIYKLDKNLEELIPLMQKALQQSGVVTFSKKFIYVKNAEPLLRKTESSGKITPGFGFVYGSGPTICAGDKIVSLVNGQLLFQGFGLRGGVITEFDKRVIEGAIWAKLNLVNGKLIDDIIEQQWSQIEKIPRKELVFTYIEQRASKKEGEEGISYHAGFLEGKGIVKEKEFLESAIKPDFERYRAHFEERFGDILAVLRAA